MVMVLITCFELNVKANKKPGRKGEKKMKIFEIKNLDCNIKENRKTLMKEFVKVMKLDHVPDKEEIGRISNKVEKKYKCKLRIFLDKDKNLMASMERGNSFSTFSVETLTEAFIKECMIARLLVLNERKNPK